jgi:hypothetical protein
MTPSKRAEELAEKYFEWYITDHNVTDNSVTDAFLAGYAAALGDAKSERDLQFSRTVKELQKYLDEKEPKGGASG